MHAFVSSISEIDPTYVNAEMHPFGSCACKPVDLKLLWCMLIITACGWWMHCSGSCIEVYEQEASSSTIGVTERASRL